MGALPGSTPNRLFGSSARPAAAPCCEAALAAAAAVAVVANAEAKADADADAAKGENDDDEDKEELALLNCVARASIESTCAAMFAACAAWSDAENGSLESGGCCCWW